MRLGSESGVFSCLRGASAPRPLIGVRRQLPVPAFALGRPVPLARHRSPESPGPDAEAWRGQPGASVPSPSAVGCCGGPATRRSGKPSRTLRPASVKVGLPICTTLEMPEAGQHLQVLVGDGVIRELHGYHGPADLIVVPGSSFPPGARRYGSLPPRGRRRGRGTGETLRPDSTTAPVRIHRFAFMFSAPFGLCQARACSLAAPPSRQRGRCGRPSLTRRLRRAAGRCCRRSWRRRRRRPFDVVAERQIRRGEGRRAVGF